MVFLSMFRSANTMYSKGFSKITPKPDKYWKRSMYRRFMWRFYGRKQNIYSIGVCYANRALRYASKSRFLRRQYMKKMWDMRLAAACNEHGICHYEFLSLLSESNVSLNRKVLTDLSIYEPRTFQSLTTFAKQRKEEVGLFDGVRPIPPGVYTHGSH